MFCLPSEKDSTLLGKGSKIFSRVDPFYAGKQTGKIYSRLPLSRTPRDSMKHFEISVLRHIRFAELRKKQLIEQPPLTE